MINEIGVACGMVCDIWFDGEILFEGINEMADEAKKTEETKKEAEEKSDDKKQSGGGIMKMIIFGVVGIVVVTGLAVGVLMFMAPEKSAEPPEENSEQVADSTNHEDTTNIHSTNSDEIINEEEYSLEDDPTVLEEIKLQLAELDVDVTGEIVEMENQMSKEDSIKEVNWIDEEKAKLSTKEDKLNRKEKELNRRDKEVTRKLLKLEQIQSNRVAQLAKLYDGMDTRAVAQLMANLDDKTIVSILPRMKTKNASGVLSLLPAKRAAKLSKQLITIAGN